YLCHSEILMPKDTESLGNNKAPACESRGFVRKIMKVCILTHLLADETFLRKVLQYIEQNLDNPEYSVEVLSRDMGMDRTGLYRRLISVVGKTPTNFIRSIRLKRAAQLLKEGYTVAEVADLVGFNTSSYLSKCFQEEFGMRPSQYINQWKNR
uniref:helix-turn-helix domain-containing protein n=1 Tax=Bacteroides stercoris TaxID=46506 RepID=UPI0021AB19D9